MIELRPASSASNFSVPCRMPPQRKPIPSTSSRLPMIDPVTDALTRSSSPALIATIPMIISAALPNVAFSSPPNFGPTWCARSSVAWPIRPETGTIPSAARTKTSSSGAPASSATSAPTPKTRNPYNQRGTGPSLWMALAAQVLDHHRGVSTKPTPRAPIERQRLHGVCPGRLPHRLDDRAGGVDRGEAGDALLGRRAADVEAVAHFLLGRTRRVDDAVDRAVVDHVEDVGWPWSSRFVTISTGIPARSIISAVPSVA